MKQVVTFDFDNTLSKPHIQDFAKLLLVLDIDVWVITSRQDELHASSVWTDPSSPDLWKVIDELEIPRNKVIFTNLEWKANYLKDTKVVWHLDDNWEEFSHFRRLKLKTVPIQVNSGNWRSKCFRLLILNKKKNGRIN